ncbi:MAG: hypothetical protein ACRCWJ_18560 [Casimicrobium sp.]
MPVVAAATTVGKTRAFAMKARRPTSIYVAPVDRRNSFAWWEYENELKRRLALEMLMRDMFAQH